MRKISFRGVRKDINSWAYGHYFSSWEQHYIALGAVNGKPDIIEVYPGTIGQHTGLKDKNGKDIYEGDIIDYSGKMTIVTYYDKMMAFGLLFPKEGSWLHVWECENHILNLEITGNIHDKNTEHGQIKD